MEEIENFKNYLLLHLNMQGDKKTIEPMSIYYSKCRGKHLLRDCPINQVNIFEICEKPHVTSSCNLLLKVI
jgi:hypothetical protein